MTLGKRLGAVATAGALPLVALAVAVCGGGNTATARPAPAKTSCGKPATIDVADR